MGAVPREIFITEELTRRPARQADYRLEKNALQDLSSYLIGSADQVLPRFVEVAMDLTGGIAAGLSLYEKTPAPGVFRWRHLQGRLSTFEGATTPRNYSPCGVTLDENRPILTRHAERFYTWISEAKIEVPEVLLVPLRIGPEEPAGTLWIVSDKEGHFDSGDARVASELAAFAGVALYLAQSRAELQSALEQQETLAKEMSHRVKNLFSIAEGMVRMTSRASATKDEMATALVGRFHALASAHGLVRRSFSQDQDTNVTDLNSLMHAIVRPHEHEPGLAPRFTIDGPPIACGETALNGIALVFHELTTNAAKYGALKADEGRIDLRWKQCGPNVDFNWIERGGPVISDTPDANGFGSKLLRDMVSRQFNGKIEHRWNPGGLEVRISLPASSLSV